MSDTAESLQHVLAETQVAGFGLANGKVVERLRIEFDRETPAAKLVHDRLDYAEPLRDRDPNLETLVEIVANPHDSHRDGEQKLEIGSSYGKDRVIVDYHEHAPRVYIRHEHFDNGEWSEAAAWELHPATGVEKVGGELVTDGGQPETTTVQPGQTWTCNEHNADPAGVPPGHESVDLWPDYPRFNAVVEAVHGDVAALVVGSSNSHPRAPDLGDRVDVHVSKLRERPEWSLKSDVADRQEERLVADGGSAEDGQEDHHELCDTLANGVAVVVEEDGESKAEIAEEGYPCPNDAVGKFELETHAGPTMEFWLCEKHLEHYRDQEAVVQEVTPDV